MQGLWNLVPPATVRPSMTPILSKVDARKKKALEIQARLDVMYPKKEIRNKPDMFYLHRPETPEEIRQRRTRRAKESIRREIDRLRMSRNQSEKIFPVSTRVTQPLKPSKKVAAKNPFEDKATWLDKKKA